jgi:raffinose/stachyose/melibiose transport system permease protein
MVNYHFGRGRARLAPYLLLLPGILIYLLISLGPSIATAGYSFTDATGIRGAPINFVGLDNYKEFLLMGQASRDNYDALLRTLIFCFFVTTIQFGLGLILALLVNQRMRGVNFFRTIYFMPVILGAVIQGLIWSLFLYPMGGPMASLSTSSASGPSSSAGSPRRPSPGSSLCRSGPTWASP